MNNFAKTNLNINSLLNDRYLIMKELNNNSQRITYLAKDCHDEKLVVVKILLFNSSFHWDNLKLFEREAKTLQNIDHPAIPKYLDYFELNQESLTGFALVQAYIQAESLETILQQSGKFSEAELIELANKILDILSFLHQQNPPIIHRDLKPSNILLNNSSDRNQSNNKNQNNIGDVYLVDFGSVQTCVSRENNTITIVGTYGYIPLEQFAGKATTASDLYSLGMTIIYLATGIHPADLTHENGQIKFSTTGLSHKFKTWLEKMIHPYIENRFTDAQQAKTNLNSKDYQLHKYSQLKPKNTNVKINHKNNHTEILLNISYFNFPKILSSLMSHGFGLYMWMIIADFLPFFYFVALIQLMVFFFSVKSKYLQKIIISEKEIKGYGSLAGDIPPIMTNLRSEISLLAYSPGYTFDEYWDSNGRQKNRGQVTTKGKLIIHAGDNKYSIEHLSEAEFWWLGKELSEILNLELQVIYPTPKLPADQTF